MFLTLQEKTRLPVDSNRFFFVENKIKSFCLEYDLPIPRIRPDLYDKADKTEIKVNISNQDLELDCQVRVLLGHYLCNLYNIGSPLSAKIAFVIARLLEHGMESHQ